MEYFHLLRQESSVIAMRIEHTVSNYASDLELKEMNKNKVGEPFHHPNTFLLLLGYAKVYISPFILANQRRNCTRACQRESTSHSGLQSNSQ